MKQVDKQQDMDNAGEAIGRAYCANAGDMYSCEEALRRLNDYLDHELTPDERVVVLQHLEICKPCFKRFSFEQTLIVSLRQKLTHVRAPETLRAKLHILLRRPE